MTMKCCASIKSGLPADASLPNPCDCEFVCLSFDCLMSLYDYRLSCCCASLTNANRIELKLTALSFPIMVVYGKPVQQVLLP